MDLTKIPERKLSELRKQAEAKFSNTILVKGEFERLCKKELKTKKADSWGLIK